MTEALRQFMRDHAEDDLHDLLLKASRFKDVDVKEAVEQITARKKAKDKIPQWYENDRLTFPSPLAVEQCSSEIAALYKQRFVQNDDRICDLTGGLGVDTWYFSQKVSKVTFVDKNKACCDAARDNFQALGVSNVQIINIDAFDYLKNSLDSVDVFYIDPSRRGSGNKRLFTISDCEPDLLQLLALLRDKTNKRNIPLPPSKGELKKLIIKLSPMLDITQALEQIPGVQEVHVVSIKNECKELLLLVQRGSTDDTPNPQIVCVNFLADGTEQKFQYRLSDETAAVVQFAKTLGGFLYEPNASILKAGAYKTVACRFGVEKLHTSSHLYTSTHPITSFPGRRFRITDVLPFNNRLCKTIAMTIPQANISVRNFPLSVDELRKRTRIVEGGDVYIFATTLSDNQKTLIICQKEY